MLSKFFNPSVRLKYFVVFLFLSQQFLFSQKGPNELKKYSHTDFIKLITSSKDTVFSLKDAFIYFDRKKDSSFYYHFEDDYLVFNSTDTLIIDKEIQLNNVYFEHWYEDAGLAFHHLKFMKPVSIENTSSVMFGYCDFEKGLYIDINAPIKKFIDYFVPHPDVYSFNISLSNCVFKGDVGLDITTKDENPELYVSITSSIFKKSPKPRKAQSKFYVKNVRSFDFTNNDIEREGFVVLKIEETKETQVVLNNFKRSNFIFDLAGVSSSSISDLGENKFGENVLLEIENFNKLDAYHWNDWNGKVVSLKGYEEYIFDLYNQNALNSSSFVDLYESDSILKTYVNTCKFQSTKSYKKEKRLLGSFYDFYKSQYDTDFSNETYVSLKDIETQRYHYLNIKAPSFKSYFAWKINQFLKIFSAYGTEPSRSVVMSIYVIFIFAFVYLFFPNSWDTMNRNRLMKRIRFYTRYFRNKESMKKIYEEEKKEDIMTFMEFKEYMHKSQKETPSYFLILAKPIYYFSSTNYKIISKLFDKTDILKGKWIDLPKRKKVFASVFMGLWILFLLCFDVIIKFINALTLSLNTFTTLGFGEIPTKGLPRYLSIIEGFIGWFMLTIFSVSLISQLLN